MRRVVAAATLAVVLAAPLAAHADDDCAARLAWIDARLQPAGHRARVWSWTWGVLFGASTVGSLVAVPFVADEERPDWYVNAFTSAAGLVPILLVPLEVMHDSDELHAQLASLPADADRCALLASAEVRLARDAASEADGRAWWNHALNVAVNGGAGLFLGLVYDRWQSGLLTAVVGSAVGEAMIFTQPTGAIDDARAYREGQAARGAISLTVMPMTFAGTPAGRAHGLALWIHGSF